MNEGLWGMVIGTWLSGASTAFAFTAALDGRGIPAFMYASIALVSAALVNRIWRRHVRSEGSTER